jgi:RHS repeat-associated protein
MRRLLVLLLALTAARGAIAADRLIPVITGTIGDRTYRTTIDLRSTTTEECRFEVRVPGGATLHAIEPVEAGKPKLLDEFAGELPVVATTARVSCTGSVDVHSRIHESADGGATYDEGALFRAVVPEPLADGQTFAMRVSGDFVVAEVHGAPARVIATLTATSSNRIADKEYDLAPFGQRSVGMADALRSLGPIEANFEIAGEGRVIILPAVTDPAFVNRAPRAPAEIRARLNAQAAAAAAPPPDTTPSVTQQLLISPFKAAPFRDPATGLVFMRGRWYDPSTGTFLTPDPEGDRDSSNLYSYCAGDPVNCSDPTGRHSFIKRKVNGLEFELLAPDPDEVRRGELGMSGSFMNPYTGKRDSFSWDQHESELFLMQARWGNPLMQDAFAQFFGMSHDQVDLSGARLYWNSLWRHKTDIALSAGFTVAMLAPQVRYVSPSTLRYTQRTAGGAGRADTLRQSMRANGWNGPPIDVVETPQGLVTVDHSRAAVAQELGIQRVPVRVHMPNEPLPPEMLGRFGPGVRTWGEAAAQRAAGQRPPLPPTGTSTPPRLPKPGGQQ